MLSFSLQPYTHFSLLMHLDKRLAAVIGLGMDGAKLMVLDGQGSTGGWTQG